MEFFTSVLPILVKKSGLLSEEGLRMMMENRVQTGGLADGADFARVGQNQRACECRA